MEYFFQIDPTLPEEEKYKLVIKQALSLIDESVPLLSNLSNITALLKETFEKISWVGFYFSKDEILYLGPFQGKTACTKINFGKGVCGKSIEAGHTIIVEDVEKFPGHIYCDADSKSEIVVPIIKDKIKYGVLDLDSYIPSAFNNTDKIYLERLVEILSEKLNLDKLERITI
ncbi:GAF domain-containing protein [Melioribacter sp. OK-6-Me]|uniref:GAF domain-containing protein n=1 Tax=unclassified Melioribacter TaxID=2627329 RepID=UPI003EDB5F06